MADFTKYISREGDRWDLISYRAYGNVNLMNLIIAANPTVPIYDVMPSGITLKIPTQAAPQVSANLLPPWKR